jgi:cytochrome c
VTARGRLARLALCLAVTAGAGAGCSVADGRVSAAEVLDSSPGRGPELIEAYGCGSCHVIPGVQSANGLVGPPLTSFGRRTFIAGQVPNTGPNLQQWIVDPQSIEPGTAMPDLGVSPLDARDIAAYLFTLE